jgi:hypothetical protein
MSKSIVSFQSADVMPAYLIQGSSLGNENVSASDMVIPTLALAQAMSPEVGKKSDPKHIKGLELGHVFNKLTGEFWDSVFVLNLKFETGFTIFKKRENGSGYEGNHPTEAAANQHIADNNLIAEHYDIVDTALHTVALLDENGENPKVAQIYMAGANKKISDAWNTALAGYKCDRFSTVWALSSAEEANKKGQSYQVFKASMVGYADEKLNAEARATYFAMQGMTDPTIH